MRIAYIFEEFPCPSETFALREIECLRRRGFEITVFCARHCDSDAGDPVRGIASPGLLSWRWLSALAYVLVRRWNRLPSLAALWWRIAIRSPRRAAAMLFDLPALGEFSKAVKTEGVSHVHGYWLGWPARMAAALSVLTGVSMSLSGHARDIFTETASLDVLARRARFLAVCTDQGLRRLHDVLGAELSSKLQMIRHGLLPEEISESDSGRNVNSAPPHIVAVGRLVEKKGFDVLLHAFKQVKHRCEDARLTIIGEGPREGSLKALAQRLGLNGCVSFAGWISHDKVLDRIRNASEFVAPSVIAADGDRDGTPNVILEAFACGTPVVASALPGIEESVEHEASGLLVPPRDPAGLAEAICRLIGDRRLAENLVLGGRRVLETRFDAMANSEHLATLFKEAIGHSC